MAAIFNEYDLKSQHDTNGSGLENSKHFVLLWSAYQDIEEREDNDRVVSISILNAHPSRLKFGLESESKQLDCVSLRPAQKLNPSPVFSADIDINWNKRCWSRPCRIEETHQQQNLSDDSTIEPTASSGFGKNLIIDDDLKASDALNTPVV